MKTQKETHKIETVADPQPPRTFHSELSDGIDRFWAKRKGRKNLEPKLMFNTRTK